MLSRNCGPAEVLRKLAGAACDPVSKRGIAYQAHNCFGKLRGIIRPNQQRVFFVVDVGLLCCRRSRCTSLWNSCHRGQAMRERCQQAAAPERGSIAERQHADIGAQQIGRHVMGIAMAGNRHPFA